MRFERLRERLAGSALCAVLLLWAVPASGQQQPVVLNPPPGQGQQSGNQSTPDQVPEGNGPKIVGPPLLPGETPPTAEELRKKQIDSYDPLAKDPAAAGTETTPNSAQPAQPAPAGPQPLPGSIADSNLPAPSRQEGPQITDGDSIEQQYNGPAVLSRSYTLNRPMTPKQVRWSWTISAGETYTAGLVAGTPANTSPAPGVAGMSSGTLPGANSAGTTATFALQGRHFWKRDQIGLSYSAGYSRFFSATDYDGVNQILNLDYGHQFSRHIMLTLVESASDLTQSGTLTNPLAQPGVSVANVSLAASPTVQPLDLVTRQSTTQIGLTWQKSARLSFNYSAGLFFVQRTGPQLSSNSGYQAQTDMNYRLTRKTTVGAYYSYVTYVFSHHAADSATNTMGLIYSYALGRSTQIRTRGGISRVRNAGLIEVEIDPLIAALEGTSIGIVESRTLTYTSDISAQLIHDFGGKRTASLSYAHGVSPGNGLILTSEQSVMSLSFATQLFRHYNVSLAVGQTSLSATLATAGSTTSDFASLSFSRTLPRNVSANLTVSYRTYQVIGMQSVPPQYAIGTGVSWGPGEGRIW